jgi:putative sigma-54 modulation protein
MEVEFTAKQVRISKALRTQAEEGMEPIARVLGKTATASITFSEQKRQKRLMIVEITIKARLQTFASEGQGETMTLALHQAIERAESQVRRRRDRKMEGKRLPNGEKLLVAPPVTRSKARAAQPEDEAGEAKPANGRKKASRGVAVHSFPASRAIVEPHIISSGDAIAPEAMTLEEAVKELESLDRDLLIFRNLSGDLFVLHRHRDGQVELVELP